MPVSELSAHRTQHGEGSMSWRISGTGNPVVLLHGGAGSWTHWTRNTEALALRHRLFVPDMPGFGDSDAVTLTNSLDPLAHALMQGLQTLIGDQPFHLVGFSFGGLVAARMAALAESRVRRLILVGASGFGLPTSLRLSLKSWRGLAAADRDAAHAHNLRFLMLTGKIDAQTIRLQAANAQRAQLNSRPWSNLPILCETLANLTVPLGAIWGAAMPSFRPILIGGSTFCANAIQPVPSQSSTGQAIGLPMTHLTGLQTHCSRCSLNLRHQRPDLRQDHHGDSDLDQVSGDEWNEAK